MDIRFFSRFCARLCLLWVYWPLLSCQSQKSAVRPVANEGGGLAGHVYYIDPGAGSDGNDGKSLEHAFVSLARLEGVGLAAGDTVRLKRGAAFTGPWLIHASGLPDRPIVITDYGDAAAKAPSFTNTVFVKGNYGNCIRIGGSYVVVEKMFCHSAAAYVRGEYTPVSGWDTTVWEMGAIYIEKNAAHCIVRNNEMEDCPVGVKSYGPFALIRDNYIHDCNRVLKEWGWGPLGIWLGGDHQEACYNRVFNYRAENPNIHWGGGTGGGADGGAFEIDDARYVKSDISIHDNYTRDCQGFLEVTWTDILQHPDYNHFHIHHNVSDDYQQFIALWCGRDCNFEQNTIIRRKKNVNDWGVFNIAQNGSHNLIHNNIIVTEKDIPVFNVGLAVSMHPESIISNNLYFAASGALVMGKEGPGEGAVDGDPLFKNYTTGSQATDFSILAGSPAIKGGGLPALGALPFVP